MELLKRRGPPSVVAVRFWSPASERTVSPVLSDPNESLNRRSERLRGEAGMTPARQLLRTAPRARHHLSDGIPSAKSSAKSASARQDNAGVRVRLRGARESNEGHHRAVLVSPDRWCRRRTAGVGPAGLEREGKLKNLFTTRQCSDRNCSGEAPPRKSERLGARASSSTAWPARRAWSRRHVFEARDFFHVLANASREHLTPCSGRSDRLPRHQPVPWRKSPRRTSSAP